MKKNTALVLVMGVFAFFLGILVSTEREEQKENQGKEIKDSSISGGEDIFNITDVGASDGADAGILNTSKSNYSIRQGNDIYSFESISFIFENIHTISAEPYVEGQPVQTQVRMKVNNFSRNGLPIKLASFRLGIYQGSCSEVKAIPYEASLGQPLAFAQCWLERQGNQIAVMQKGKSILAYSRAISENNPASEPLNKIFEIDLSQLIQ